MTANGAVAMGGWRVGTPAACVGGAALLVAAGLVGFLVHPLLGFAVLGLLGAPALVANPRWLLFLFAALLPFDGVAALDDTRALTLTRLLGVAVFGAWALHLVVERRAMRLARPAVWFVAFAAFASLSLVWAANFEITLNAVMTLVQLLLLAIVAADLLRDPRDVRLTIDVMLASTVIVALLVLSEVSPATKRASLLFLGRTFESNYLAASLVCPAVAALGIGAAGRSTGMWRSIAIVPIALAVFLTGSRGGGIALVGGVVAIGVLRRRLSPGVAAAALGLAVLLPSVVPQTTIDQLWSRYADAEQDRLSGRVDIWKVGTAMVHAHPLAGVAFGGFPGAFYDFMLTTDVNPEFGHLHARGNRAAHNIYLSTVAELGVVGGVLLAGGLGAHLRLLWRGRQAAQRRRDTERDRLLVALFGVFTSLLLLGSAIDLLGTKAPWLWFGMMQATALGAVGAARARRA